jgi:hypothetical protein
MRRLTSMAIAAAFLLFTASTLSAQAKPDFSGKWTREAPAGGAAAGGGGGGGGGRGGGGGGQGGGGGFNCGMTFEIKVSGNNLTISRMQGDQAVTTTLDMNGTSTYKVSMRGTEVEIKTVGKWEGNKLVFSTTRDMQGTAITSTQTVSIEGGKLTVVSNSGREGATPTTATYTKG